MIAAAQRDLGEFVKSSALPVLGLLVLISVAVWVIIRIRERYRDREDHAAMPHQLLLQYREMQREGDLTDEEYRSIKNRLVQQVESSARGATPLRQTNRHRTEDNAKHD